MNCTVSGGLRARIPAAWRREVGRAARVRSRGRRGIYRGSQGSKYGRGSPGVTSPDRARSRHREKGKRKKKEGRGRCERWQEGSAGVRVKRRGKRRGGEWGS